MKKQEFKNKLKRTCKHCYSDGAGYYCDLIPMDSDKDYPHKHWRVMCSGKQSHPFCEKNKQNGKLRDKE